ncbi:TPA: GPW/gp25 family protein [Neisseria lactamica]|uniref:GPW/gp25 family protein n=1 Tax=Neisseria lactamica TaxID=486 RepID=UPI000305CEA6|nr:GPW/gp25 family protein [Neisseria lactamica]
MFYAAPISKHWQLAPESADDIDQCIRNILSTRKGADVTRPDFGSDHYKWLDTPEDVFVPNIVRETVLAIQTWEKRVVVEDIIFGGAAPHLTMTVYWRIADEAAGEIYSTDIRLEQAAWT